MRKYGNAGRRQSSDASEGRKLANAVYKEKKKSEYSTRTYIHMKI